MTPGTESARRTAGCVTGGAGWRTAAAGCLLSASMVVTPADAADVTCLGAPATITGDDTGEVITGTAGDDVIAALGGSDQVSGLGGNDRICLGPGDDTSFASGGVNTIEPGPGDDTVWGNDADLADRVHYTFVTDPVIVDLGAGTATGEGADTLHHIRQVVGGSGSDTITGSPGPDVLDGGWGLDVLDGAGGDDLVMGGDQPDMIAGGPGADHLVGNHPGEPGINDTASYAGSASPVTASLETQSATGQGADTFEAIEQLVGSPLADTLIGMDNPEDHYGSDYLVGGAGDDTLRGLAGYDLLEPGPGDDRVFGGDDFAELLFVHAARGVTVDLAAGTAWGEGADSLAAIGMVLGSPYADRITGDNLEDNLWGMAGDDVLRGRAGPDNLVGGEGDNTLVPGPGDDLVYPGSGWDRVSFADSGAAIRVDLVESVAVGAGYDRLYVWTLEEVIGGKYADVIAGDGRANVLRGGAGRDVIRGRAGADHLYGNTGADQLIGGDGNDHCDGGAGTDEAQACERRYEIP